jgi:TonB family protein
VDRRQFTKTLGLSALALGFKTGEQGASVAGGPNSWKIYSVKDEEFSISFPTQPAVATSRSWNEQQKERTERIIGAYAQGIVYVIESFENIDPRQSLAAFIDLSRSKRNLRFVKEVNRNGFSGKEYAPEGARVDGTLQFFSTEKHLYVFEVIGVSSDDPRVTHFFSSLSLGPKASGELVPDGLGVPFHAEEPGTTDSNGISSPKIYVGKEVDRKAVLGAKPQPTYTEAARRNSVAGTVVLRVVFSAAGNVINVRVVSGLPDGLTERATDAAKKIKFIPAIKDSQFVSTWIQLEYNFNLY